MRPLARIALCFVAFGSLHLLGGCGSGSESSSTTGGGSSVCDDFRREEGIGALVKVRLVNQTGNNLYLGDPSGSGCGSPADFVVNDAEGHLLPWRAGDCEFTCEALMKGSCGCADICAPPSVRLVAPGGTYEVAWAGTIFTPVLMRFARARAASSRRSRPPGSSP
jgi:hypothetical protein